MTAMTKIQIAGNTAAAFVNDMTPVLRAVFGVTALFGEPVWNLSAADPHNGRSTAAAVLDWREIDRLYPGWSRTCRELCWHRLNTNLVTNRTIGVYHAVSEQMRMRRFLRWLHLHHPTLTNPALITQTVIHSYRLHLERHDKVDQIEAAGGNRRLGETITPHTVWTYMLPIKALDLYAANLSTPLSFSPYNGQLSAAFLGWGGNDDDDNATPVLPDEVLQPLIQTAIRYVEHYASQIEAMSDEMLAFWSEGKSGRPFPGWKTQIEDCPDLKGPWRPQLNDTKRRTPHLYRDEMSNLIAACIVIILYLSGMRPGEVCNLMSTCRRSSIDGRTGLRNRCKLTGKPLKKRGQKASIDVDWIVPPLVEQAVQILERLLAPYREIHGSDLLIMNQNALRGTKKSLGFATRRTKPGYPLSVNSLGVLVAKLYARARDHHPDAPEYTVMPSQFRRTLARHIARQPFGIIAGKLHYHHVSTAIFQGYAGSTSDTFAHDVADERILSGIDVLEGMRTDARAGWSGGAGAMKMLGEWDRVRERVMFDGVIDTSATSMVLDNAVRRLAETVHVGALTYCMFDVANAACLSQAEKERRKSEPNINMCSPDRCANAAIASCHLPKWQGLKDEVDALAKKARSGPQRTALKSASERYAAVIRKASL